MAKEKVAKLRIRKSNHALNRTLAGDMGINIMLLVVGTLMALPMVYNIMQAFKPLNEMFLYPPRFFVINPTLKNFTDLFRLMGTSWVPFSRYIFNTAFIAIAGTFGNVVLSSMAAYSLSKLRYPGRNFLFKMIVYSLMFNSTVTGITSFIVIKDDDSCLIAPPAV
ncbi:MAG: carbohydrate ABC transporter permease [Clostridia bacterium]|nr:carbohydrate ABC transporter permease [Clostridia bacterium]